MTILIFNSIRLTGLMAGADGVLLHLNFFFVRDMQFSQQVNVGIVAFLQSDYLFGGVVVLLVE